MKVKWDGAKMRYAVCALALFAMISCASERVRAEFATPARDVLSRDLTTEDPSKCLVVVVRDSGFGGSGCKLRVMVDGESAANLKPEEKVSLYLTPGEHVVEVTTNGGLCGNKMAGATIKLERGVAKAYRVGFPASGDVAIYPTTLD